MHKVIHIIKNKEKTKVLKTKVEEFRSIYNAQRRLFELEDDAHWNHRDWEEFKIEKSA